MCSGEKCAWRAGSAAGTISNGGTLKTRRGFTLIELLIATLILGLIAFLAIPGYRRFLLRSHRPEAQLALLQLQISEEKFHLLNNAFTDQVTAARTASPPGLGLPAVSETGKYDIAVTTLGPGAQSYTATAAARAGGPAAGDAECTALTITERGTRGSAGTAAPKDCWK